MSSPATGMQLYSDPTGIHSHRVRLMLAEKDVQVHVQHTSPAQLPDVLAEVNVSASLPLLVDRDLVLYDDQVIVDYLDERHPHPPFMPVDPVSRARMRLALHRIRNDWYALLPALSRKGAARDEAAAQLAGSLAEANDVFDAMPFFFSDAYSILDATLAPLLWRLPQYGIVLDRSASAVLAYAERMFSRSGFQASLSQQEREMSA